MCVFYNIISYYIILYYMILYHIILYFIIKSYMGCWSAYENVVAYFGRFAAASYCH